MAIKVIRPRRKRTGSTTQFSVTFRIGKKTEGAIEWLTEECSNLITDWGMQAIYRYPVASLNQTVILGTSAEYPKVFIENLTHSTTMATALDYLFTENDVGKQIIHSNGNEFKILSISGTSAITEDIGTAYYGSAILGKTDQITLVDPILISSTVDPAGIANEKVFFEETSLLRISNVRCVVFDVLDTDCEIKEIGWTPSSTDIGLTSYVTGRKVLDKSVKFKAGETPYIQVGVHRVFDCSRTPVEDMDAYTGTGHCQLLLHQPQFTSAYYSTIGPYGETVLPTQNSLFEPYRAKQGSSGKFVVYTNPVDYKNDVKSMAGDLSQHLISAPISQLLALSTTSCAVLGNQLLSLYVDDGEALSVITSIEADSTTGRLGKTSTGEIVVGGGTSLEIFRKVENTLVSVDSVVLPSTYANMKVTVSDLIILSNSAGIIVYRYQDNGLILVGEYTLNYGTEYHIAPDYADRFAVVGYGILTLYRIDGTSLVQIAQQTVAEQTVSSFTRLRSGIFHVGSPDTPYLVYIVGSTIQVSSEETVSGTQLYPVRAEYWYNPSNGGMYHALPTGNLEFVDTWRRVEQLSGYASILFTKEGSYLKRYEYTGLDRIYFTSGHSITREETIIFTANKINIVAPCANNRLFIGTSTEWGLFTLDLEQAAYVTMSTPCVGVAENEDYMIISTEDTLYFTSKLSMGVVIAHSGLLGSNRTHFIALTDTLYISCSLTGVLRLFSISDTTVTPINTLDIQGTQLQKITDSSFLLVNGSTIYVCSIVNGALNATYATYAADGPIEALTLLHNGVDLIIYTTATGMYSILLSDPAIRATLTTEYVGKNISLVGHGEDLLIVTETCIEVCSICGSQFGRWGIYEIPAVPNFKTHYFNGTQAYISNNGIFSKFSIDNPSLGNDRVLDGLWHMDPLTPPIYGLGFSNTDVYDESKVEWYLGLDTPISYDTRKVLKISLRQCWTRQNYTETED